MPDATKYVKETIQPIFTAHVESALGPHNVRRFSPETKAVLASKYRDLLAELALEGGAPSLAEQLANGFANGEEFYPQKAMQKAIDDLGMVWQRIGVKYGISTQYEQKSLRKLNDALDMGKAIEAIELAHQSTP